MTVNPAVKVGIIVFVALLVFGATAVFLTGYHGRGYPVTVIFDDVMGLTEGSSVTMAGVRIGRVEDIRLTKRQRAAVLLRIGREYRIPKGSEFVLRVGLLVGEKSVDIIPNRNAKSFLRPWATVAGRVPPRVEDILPDARRLVANLTEVSASLRDSLRGMDIKGPLARSLANVEHATASLDQTMAGLRNVVTAQSDELSGIVNNILVASKNIRELTAELERVAKEGQLGEHVRSTLLSAERAVASLERTSASLEKLLTSPDLQTDIREAISEARQAASEARTTMAKLGKVLEGPKVKVGMPTSELSLETLYGPDNGRFRTNVSAELSRDTDSFLKVGIYDLGGTNKLIFQAGQPLDSHTDIRYGIYASKLGIGLDREFSRRFYTIGNLYDPVEPRIDIMAGYKVNSNLDLVLGIDRLFDDNQPTLGVRVVK
jgi:phospholipid/cholesterol/gamma-HCH transport system substrate-binding protein